MLDLRLNLFLLFHNLLFLVLVDLNHKYKLHTLSYLLDQIFLLHNILFLAVNQFLFYLTQQGLIYHTYLQHFPHYPSRKFQSSILLDHYYKTPTKFHVYYFFDNNCYQIYIQIYPKSHQLHLLLLLHFHLYLIFHIPYLLLDHHYQFLFLLLLQLYSLLYPLLVSPLALLSYDYYIPSMDHQSILRNLHYKSCMVFLLNQNPNPQQ